jgi:uncharacterized membrane protein YidH (DUF202 family)
LPHEATIGIGDRGFTPARSAAMLVRGGLGGTARRLMASLSVTAIPTGVVVVGIPLAIVTVNLVSDLARQRGWRREHWVLGRDFALAAVAIAILNCLLWLQRYLDAVRQLGPGVGEARVERVLEPAETTLVVALLVLTLAGAMLAAVQWLLAPRASPHEPPISYPRIVLINGLGLVPLIVAALVFTGGR